MKSCELFCLDWIQTVILLISAFQVAGITGLSYSTWSNFGYIFSLVWLGDFPLCKTRELQSVTHIPFAPG
jgi:hypothetical protein